MRCARRLLALETARHQVRSRQHPALCAALGHPERAYRSVLIAGTNGKGSVTAMVEAALRAAGHRTARYTSPHLIDLDERFASADGPLSERELARSPSEVLRRRGERCTQQTEGRVTPTFFEVTTARGVRAVSARRAWRWRCSRSAWAAASMRRTWRRRWRRDHVDRASITSSYLGDTLEAIAFEKAGIIKPACRSWSETLPGDALRVVASRLPTAGASRRRWPKSGFG